MFDVLLGQILPFLGFPSNPSRKIKVEDILIPSIISVHQLNSVSLIPIFQRWMLVQTSLEYGPQTSGIILGRNMLEMSVSTPIPDLLRPTPGSRASNQSVLEQAPGVIWDSLLFSLMSKTTEILRFNHWHYLHTAQKNFPHPNRNDWLQNIHILLVLSLLGSLSVFFQFHPNLSCRKVKEDAFKWHI